MSYCRNCTFPTQFYLNQCMTSGVLFHRFRDSDVLSCSVMFSSINLLTLPISDLAGFMNLQGSFEENFGLWSFSRTKA